MASKKKTRPEKDSVLKADLRKASKGEMDYLMLTESQLLMLRLAEMGLAT